MNLYLLAALVIVGATAIVAVIKSQLATYDIIDGARWLTGIGKWRLLRRRPSGVLADGRRRLSVRRSEMGTIVSAPSGAGKSSSVIIPNVLALKNGSAIVTDLAGEIFDQTAGKKAEDGFQIAVFNLSDPSRSLSFNPLQHSAGSHTEINKISETLVTSAFPEEGSNKFWNDAARSAIAIIIKCVMNTDPKFANLGNVYRLCNSFGPDGSGLDDFVLKHADKTVFTEFLGLRSNSERTFASLISTARTALSAFSDPNLCRITSTDTLGISTLRERPTILYLIVRENELPYFAFMLSLLYQAIFDMAMLLPKMGEPYLPLLLLLDEVGHLRIPGFAMYTSTLRKRSCQIVAALQSEFQLESQYGRQGAQEILAGSLSTKIYLPGLPYSTCSELERVLGRQTLEDRKTGQRFSQPLATADEIRTMRDGTGIMVSGNSEPVKLRMTAFFERRDFGRYSKIPPPEIPVSENSELDYIDLQRDETSTGRLPEVPVNAQSTSGNGVTV
ncbi:MAG: hypothetical protein BMS9Abin05_2690 [Rhodothermia bacterium]|nr:MAG: hypothetical protein BMS9Abin05_2690 [Rhodothermia bacterium]